MKFRITILWIAITLFIVACGESAEEKATKEREIKKLLMKFTDGVPCISLSLTSDSLDKELIIVIGIMEDSSRIEAFVKKDKDGNYVGREAFGSTLARDMSSNIGMRVTDLSLEKVNEMGDFKGKARLKSGEKIIFHANINKGWYPENDLNTLQTITKYQIIKNLAKGEVLDSISISPTHANGYSGKYTLKSGASQPILVVHTGEGFNWSLGEAQPQKKEEKK